MKNTLKMMWILALGAGLFTMSSCTDDDEDPEPDGSGNTGETVCYPTKVVSTDSDGDDTYDYTYNSDNQLIESKNTYDGDLETTTYDYTDGKLMTATSGTSVATFVYADGAAMPNRVNITEDGENSEFLIIETNSDDQITKVEYHYYDDGQAMLDFVDTYTYIDGSVETYISETYDNETETFETDLELTDFVFDDKKSPYGGQLAFSYEGDFNPLTVTRNNLISANLIADDGQGGQLKLPYNATYEYNANKYPTSSSLTLLGQSTNIVITYNCK